MLVWRSGWGGRPRLGRLLCTRLHAPWAALRAHLANPAVGEALAKAPQHTDGMAIAIYGELAPETREWADGLGLPITWYPWKLGFSGMMGPRSLPRA